MTRRELRSDAERAILLIQDSMNADDYPRASVGAEALVSLLWDLQESQRLEREGADD